MKKNRMMRLASILLVCVLLSTSVISGTFAKYISTASASDTARVAKWEILYTNGENESVDITGTNETIVFDLFNTVKEADTFTSETDVKDGNTTTIIAPGTGGSFKMKVENKSEVTAKYNIVLTESNDNAIYIQYSLDKNTWYDDFDAINGNTTEMKDVTLDMETGSKEITVYWRWCFEGTTNGAHKGQNDASDTLLGAMAQDTAPTVTVSASITVEQVD